VILAADPGLKTFVLSKRETSELIEKLKSSWPAGTIPTVKSITVHELREGNRLLVANDAVIGVQIAEHILPFVGASAGILSQFPAVTVDMGAVRFVCNGAKVMRPGITKFDSFKKGGIVLVRDLVHGKVLASGLALEDSETAQTMEKGYVIENLHYISDEMWEGFKQI
jgi:PUA domain protein